jgi:hypothetical protein
MNRTSKLVTFAGVVACISSAAIAQTPDRERAFAMDLLADADGRSSLLQAGGTSGYNSGTGFFIASADGNNRLNVRVLQQFRYYLNFGDNDRGIFVDDGDGDFEFVNPDNADFAQGFENNQTRFTFDGNMINQDLTYKIQFGFDAGGNLALEDAYGQYMINDDVYIKWGQFRAPVLAEEFRVDDQHQLAAGRSIVSNLFSPGRVQGVAVGFRGEDFGIHGSVNQGAGSANSFFTDEAADFGFTVRADWKFAGQWDQFNDFTSFQGSENAGVVGAALHYQFGGETLGSFDANVLLYTIDFQYEGDGWNVFAAFVGQNFDPEGDDSSDNFGILVQGGIFLTEQVELFGRWDLLLLDDDFFEEDVQNFITLGANYYFIPGSHAAKFTGDVVIGINKEYDGLVAPNSGLLGNLDNTGEVGVRLQMQLAF